MRSTVPITVALVVLSVSVAPITAQQTTTECGPADGSMTTNGTMMNETTTGMASETTESVDDEGMDGMGNETTTQTMAGGSMNDTTTAETTTPCEEESMDGDSMTDTTESMNDSMSETTERMDDSMTETTESMDGSMDDTTDAPASGSSAFAPGFGVGAALVALLAALYVVRRRP